MDSNYLTWINPQYIMYILSLWNTNGLYMGCKIASYPAITTGQKQRLFTFTLRWHHGSSRSIRGESRGIFTKLRCILTDQKSWLPSTIFFWIYRKKKGVCSKQRGWFDQRKRNILGEFTKTNSDLEIWAFGGPQEWTMATTCYDEWVDFVEWVFPLIAWWFSIVMLNYQRLFLNSRGFYRFALWNRP
jgi:hypothetical protein